MAAAVQIRHSPSHIWLDNAIGMVVAAVTFSALFFVFDPIQPVRFTGGEVLTQQVHPGNSIKVRWDMQWARMCPGHSTRYAQTHDGAIHTLSGIDVTPPNFPGEISTERDIQIPLTFIGSPGDASIWTVLTLHCWPWKSQEFTITSQKLQFNIL